MAGVNKQDPGAPVPVRRSALLRTVRAVAWAMFGVRDGDEYRKDQHALQPLQVMFVGLVALVLFVLLLMLLVHWIV